MGSLEQEDGTNGSNRILQMCQENFPIWEPISANFSYTHKIS